MGGYGYTNYRSSPEAHDGLRVSNTLCAECRGRTISAGTLLSSQPVSAEGNCDGCEKPLVQGETFWVLQEL